MRIIQAVYPCVQCSEEISPLDELCKFCGAKQPGLEGKLLYDVFYRRDSDLDLLYAQAFLHCWNKLK